MYEVRVDWFGCCRSEVDMNEVRVGKFGLSFQTSDNSVMGACVRARCAVGFSFQT